VNDELSKLIEQMDAADAELRKSFPDCPPCTLMAKALAALKAVLTWNRISPPDMSGKVHIRYPSLSAEIRRAILDAEASK